jgi:hypothetical protein
LQSEKTIGNTKTANITNIAIDQEEVFLSSPTNSSILLYPQIQTCAGYDKSNEHELIVKRFAKSQSCTNHAQTVKESSFKPLDGACMIDERIEPELKITGLKVSDEICCVLSTRDPPLHNILFPLTRAGYDQSSWTNLLLQTSAESFLLIILDLVENLISLSS